MSTFRRRSRGPFVASILAIGVAVVVFGTVLYVIVTGAGPIRGNIPLGSTLALRRPTNTAVPAIPEIPCTGPAPSQCYSYSCHVTAVNSSDAWNYLMIRVYTSVGIVVGLGNASHVGIAGYAVFNAAGSQGNATQELVYSIGNQEDYWAAGIGSGSSRISTAQLLVVYVAGSTSDPDPLAGDAFVAFGDGAHRTGAVQVVVP